MPRPRAFIDRRSSCNSISPEVGFGGDERSSATEQPQKATVAYTTAVQL